MAVLPFLAFALGLTWLAVVSPLPGPVTIALSIAAMVFVTPPLCWLALRIMDLIAP